MNSNIDNNEKINGANINGANINGGKAIDSGGFGCIFLPSLRCENSINTQNNSFISKLMLNKDTDEEYNSIQKFKEKLKYIPNYKKYFLLSDIKVCKPSQLSSDDLENYNSKCTTLIEQGITSSNINTNLDKVKTMNMPFGGINIKKFIKHNFNSADLIKLNNSLIKLLSDGIIPMNRMGVYHGDLKSSNMLADKSSDGNINVKIIDWGLSFIHENIREMPKYVKRPIQFNLPVSVVLFNASLQEKLNTFLSVNPEWTMKNVKIFTARFLNDYIKTRDNSHLMILLRAIDDFGSLNSILTRQFDKNPTNHILDYVSEALYKYTQNGIFNNLAYLNQIYLKNMDIWGFMTCYLDFYDIISDKKKLNSGDKTFLGKIKKIIMEILFLNSSTPINVSILVDRLMDLNSIFPKLSFSEKIGGKKNIKSIRKKCKKKYHRKKCIKTKKRSIGKNKTRKYKR
jgi:hypothetical protein